MKWLLLIVALALEIGRNNARIIEYRHRHKQIDFFWNSSNHLFEQHIGAMFRLNWHDSLILHCPTYSSDVDFDATEQTMIYRVSKSDFDQCNAYNPIELVGTCDEPYAVDKLIHLIFRKDPAVDREQFLITTSDGDPAGLFEKKHGLCRERHMKLKITLSDPAHNREIEKLRDENADKTLLPDLLPFEEYGQLNWKRPINDPRIPEDEQSAEVEQDVKLEFDRTLKVDKPLLFDHETGDGQLEEMNKSSKEKEDEQDGDGNSDEELTIQNKEDQHPETINVGDWNSKEQRYENEENRPEQTSDKKVNTNPEQKIHILEKPHSTEEEEPPPCKHRNKDTERIYVVIYEKPAQGSSQKIQTSLLFVLFLLTLTMQFAS